MAGGWVLNLLGELGGRLPGFARAVGAEGAGLMRLGVSDKFTPEWVRFVVRCC